MADNLSYMALDKYAPLTEKEEKTIEKAREALNSIERIPCTSCRYCTGGCPMKINIPEIFGVMNEFKLYGNLDKAKRRYAMFGQGEGSLADACIKCGQCEGACPQHLPIITYLEEIAAALG